MAATTELVPAELLELLCCPFPECRKPFTQDLGRRQLVCQGCGRRYRVGDDGIPCLLREEAEPPLA